MPAITITEGSMLIVSEATSNIGDVNEEKDIDMTIASTTEDTIAHDLDAGETEAGELYWKTESGDAGTYTVTVASPDSTDSIEVEVQ